MPIRNLFLLPLLALSAALACAQPTQISKAAQPASATAIPERERAPNDQSAFRRFVLPNGMKVILLSDPKLNQSSAALAVGVGNLADPPDRQGMAHFLEHMLFLGTKKFPDVSDFDSFLTSNGGGNNAYTARDRTNYHFEIRHEAFEGALDRFSQFFVAPLFAAEFTEREMNAVDSEHQKNLENDMWRELVVRNSMVREGHPAHKFGTGSRATLAGTTREELLAFYDKHYSANVMTLALTGKASLDELEQLARNYFAAVPNRQLKPLHYAPDYLPPKPALRIVRLEPLKDLRHMTLSFPLPDLRTMWPSKPAEQLSFVLGHEGKGSLLAALKAEGLATSLSAGSEAETHDYGSFDLRIGLTPAGLEKKERVLELTFAMIDKLRSEGLPTYLFTERQTMARLDEEYRDKGEGTGRAAELANLVMDYPLDVAERVPYLWLRQDKAALDTVLALLRPDNMLLTLVAKGVPTDKTDPYYGARYSVAQETGSAYTSLLKPPAVAALALPSPNSFVPTAPALLPVEPVHLIDEPTLSLYYAQDNEFQRPLVSHLMRFRLPRGMATLRSAVLADFYGASVREALNEAAYSAAEAGLHYQVGADLEGVVIAVDGYDASAGRLLDTVAASLVEFELSESRFAALKERLLREYAAFERVDAYQALQESRRRALREFHFRPDEKLPLARDVTLAQVRAFARELYARGRLEAVTYGNIGPADASAAVRRVAVQLKAQPVPPAELLRRRTLVTQAGEAVRTSERLAVNNSAYRQEFVLGRETPELRAANVVLGAFVSEPFYTELRTRQQLGYIVGGGTGEEAGNLFAYFVVQSANLGADAIEARATEFIAKLPGLLQKLDADAWKTLVAGARANLTERDKSVSERAGRLFALAYEHDADWARRESTLAALDQLTQQRAAVLLATALAPRTAQTRTFLGFGRGHEPASAPAVSFTDAQVWKKGRHFE